MRKIGFALSLPFQIILTFAVLFVIYIAYAILDVYEADMVNGLGLIVVQPILAAILALITIIICFVVGLPIRLNAKIRHWWLARPWLPIIGSVIGLLLLLLSFHPDLTETKQIILDSDPIDREEPNTTASITGWFLTAFCLLHYYPESVLSLFRKHRPTS